MAMPSARPRASGKKSEPERPKKKKQPVFLWKAKAASGEERTGEMEAASREEVEARLRQSGLVPLKIKKKPTEIHLRLPGSSGVTRKELVIFTRQFSTMIDAGLPLVQGLEILAAQNENPQFKQVLREVKEKVESGSTFADALRDHPKVFDDLYVQLVQAGEVGGILDTILQRLAVYIEKAEALKRKVKGAMVYPSIVLVVALGVVTVLLLFVTPVFKDMFEAAGGDLPGPTQLIVDLSEWLRANILYLVAGIVAVVVAFRVFARTKFGRRVIDAGLLKAPIFGDLLRKVAVARFSRTLGTMLSSGVPILDAMNVTAKTAGNVVLEEAIFKVRGKISEGRTIVQPLAEVGVFPQMVVEMIGVGEATGAMDAMLSKIADFYDEEVDSAVSALTSMIEPILIVFMGGIVGFFVAAMYLPIFTMAEAIK